MREGYPCRVLMPVLPKIHVKLLTYILPIHIHTYINRDLYMHTIHIIMLNNCSTHTHTAKEIATHTPLTTTTLNACIYTFMKYINIYMSIHILYIYYDKS